MNAALTRQLGAEALGTCLLVATVVGSGIMAETLAGGNVAIALLGNTLPTGAILFVLITMLGPISGAHFNPIVTLVFALRGALPMQHAAAYAAFQCIGAILGTVLAHLMFAETPLQLGSQQRASSALWLSEGVASFGLVLTILLTLRSRANAVATSVALYIVAAYWFTASTSFANPAVTLARSLTESFSGIRPVDVPAFILAQAAGAILAMLAAAILKPQKDAELR